MKIALSVDALSPELTGIGRYNWELAQSLAADPSIAELGFVRGRNWVSDPSVFLLADAPTAKRPKIRPPRWLARRRMKKDLKSFLFHSPNYFLPVFVDRGVITVHDLSVFHFPETHPIERVRQFEKEFPLSLDRATHVITDSETVRQEVIEFAGVSPERITAIPLGVSSAFKPQACADIQPLLTRYDLKAGQYALCISTIEPRKKITELLKAWQLIPAAAKKGKQLVLAGSSGWLSENINAAIARGVAEGWLRYLGFVPESDLPALYAGASLFVYPSSYEGFGLPPTEAMASGVPAIVSDRSCLPEITQGAAEVFDPDDMENFAAVLEMGLIDDQWRTHAIACGREVAARYTWESCATLTRELYHRVAND